MPSSSGGAVLAARSDAVVVGRERERRALRRLVGSPTAAGRAVAVVGEAGSGRTTMLRLTASAADGVRTIWLGGARSEVALRFAAAADLLLPLAEHFRRLPRAQRDALEVALALRPGAEPGALAVCAAALAVLSAEAERAPLLILVDDWQWIDRESQQVLLFVARRLVVGRVGLVLALRAHEAEGAVPPGMPVVELPGLSAGEGRALAAGLGVEVSDEVLEHLVELTAGNPLALTDALTSAPRADLVGPVAVPHGLALGARLRRAWAEVLDDLPPATSTALSTAAAARSGAPAEVEAALTRLGGELTDLAPAERRGLVRVRPGGVEWRHPLLRQVVLDRTPASEQRRVHRALADAADGHGRAWYAAAVAVPPDDAVADALAAAAVDARDRGDHTGATRLWSRAAEFTTGGPLRGDRLLAAAAAALRGGRDRGAAALAGAALAARGDDPVFAADAELVRARAGVALGRSRRTAVDLRRAAAAVRDADRERAAALHAEAVWPCLLSGDLRGALDVVDRCLTDPTDRAGLPAAAASALALAVGGRTAEARTALARAEDALADRPRDEPHPHHAVLAGRAAVHLEEYDRAERLLRTALDGARRAAVPAGLASALLASAELAWWTGEWGAGRADAAEVARRAGELGEAGPTAWALAALARWDAVRGDAAAVRARVERAAREVGPGDLGRLEVQLPAVSGLAALSAGRLEEAVECLDRAVGGPGGSTAVTVLGDLIEVRLRIGDRAGAEEAVRRAEAEAAATGLAHPAALAARGRGALAADVDGARSAFARAAAVHARGRVPFERARTLLCEGETMRRLRRPAAARGPLQEALRIFDRLGARPWSARAEGELAATGAPGARGDPDRAGLDSLTPQELRVARAVAAGLSNPEAAAVVFLSRKTVEAHLSRAYRKLGIRSRSQLARLFGEQRVERADG